MSLYFYSSSPVFQKGAPASSRVYHFNQSLDEYYFLGDTNYHDKASLTFTPGGNETWMIIATWQMKNLSGIVGGHQTKLVRTSGTPTDLILQSFERKDDLDYVCGGGVCYETFGASPGPQTYKIQARTSNAGAAITMKGAKIFAIRLEANDEYNSSVGDSSYGTDTTFQDKVSLVFTPPSQGDYLILASAVLDNGPVSWGRSIRLNYNSDTTIYDSSWVCFGAASEDPWMVALKKNLDASEHTFKIQWATGYATSAVTIRQAYIIALRLDDFPNAYYAESEARTTTSQTSYQDKVSLQQTLQAVDHLVIGTAGTDSSDIGRESFVQLLQDSTSLGVMAEAAFNTNERHRSYMTINKFEAAAQSYTWKFQHKGESINSSGIQDARITVLQLQSAGLNSVKTVSGLAFANVKTINGLAAANVKTLGGLT